METGRDCDVRSEMTEVMLKRFRQISITIILVLVFALTAGTAPGYADEEYDETKPWEAIYWTKQVTLTRMPVYEYKEDPSSEDGYTIDFLKEPIEFEFYNCTTQQIEGVYTAENGYVEDVPMIYGHTYLVTALDTQRFMPKHYITLAKTGTYPLDVKDNYSPVYGFLVAGRTKPLEDPVDAKRRISYTIPVQYNGTPVSGVMVRLISPQETIEVESDENGEITFDLIEDCNYVVTVEDDQYSIESFPLTLKDKAEVQTGGVAFNNHFSCGPVQVLNLVDTGTEHDHDTVLRSLSGKTAVTGMNFLNDLETDTSHYFVNDRQLDKSTVTGLSGKDYEVFAVEAINMYRIEISKLAAGEFRITRTVPQTKKVSNVYYVDDDGTLVEVDFKETNKKVTFNMDTLSMYPNVIVYQTVESKPIYRLYNKKTKEHLWTPDKNEYKLLPDYGWTQEGTAWNAPKEGKPVYRLFNPKTKDHHYTSSVNEVKVLTAQHGWKKDNNGKPLFYSGGSKPVYRLYNKSYTCGAHHLTISANEYKTLPKYGWKQEGTAMYAVR